MLMTLGVNATRLIGEFGKFFESGDDLLSELVQNAYRAKATRIDISWDSDTKLLTAEDNGTGITSPEAVFNAGSSGWDSSYHEPAGLGLFGFLATAEHVRISTSTVDTSWSTEFTGKSARLGKEFNITEVEPSSDTYTWIELKLKGNPYFSHNGWRNLWPIEVYFNNSPIESKEISSTLFGLWSLRLVDYGRYDTNVYLSREHRVAKQANVKQRIIDVLKTKTHYDPNVVWNVFLGEDLCKQTIVIELNPDDKVSHRLPDRAALINDEHLTEFIDRFTDMVVQQTVYRLDEFKAHVLRTHDPVIKGSFPANQSKAHLGIELSLSTILTLSGYTVHNVVDTDSTYSYYMDNSDGGHLEIDETNIWVRSGYGIDAPMDLVGSLGLIGNGTDADLDFVAPLIVCTSLCTVIWCKQATIKSAMGTTYEIPLTEFVLPNYTLDRPDILSISNQPQRNFSSTTEGLIVITAATPEELLDRLNSGFVAEWDAALVLLLENNCDLDEYVNDDESIDIQGLGKHLCKNVADALQKANLLDEPTRNRAYKQHVLHNVNEQVRKMHDCSFYYIQAVLNENRALLSAEEVEYLEKFIGIEHLLRTFNHYVNP